MPQQVGLKEKHHMVETKEVIEHVDLLVCKCRSCTHWEIGKRADGSQFILCRTCGVELPVKLEVGNDMLTHWAKHPLHEWHKRTVHPHLHKETTDVQGTV
jgi:hypothetical protein